MHLLRLEWNTILCYWFKRFGAPMERSSRCLTTAAPYLLYQKVLLFAMVSEEFVWHLNSSQSEEQSQLSTHTSTSTVPEYEPYLNISDFESIRSIARLPCSSQALQIEKGKHRNILRENRLCKFCPMKVVKTDLTLFNSMYFFQQVQTKVRIAR